MSGTAMEKLSQATQLLAEAKSLEDVTRIRSMAQAAEQYARAEKMGRDAEGFAYEIRVRAARKAGELLRQMVIDGERARQSDPAHGRAAKVIAPIDDLPPTLAQLGVTGDQSHRWQRLAALPEDEFERRVDERWGEVAMARQQPRTAIPNGSDKSVVRENGRTKGPTLRQSLRGLEQAAMQVQGLAEALDGQLYGDWSRLLDIDEAQPLFDVIAESLPIVIARLKRVLRDRGEHVRTQQRVG